MKKIWLKIKPALIVLLWLIGCSGVIVLMGASMLQNGRALFSDVSVSIDQNEEHLFLGEEDILQILRDHQLNSESPSALNSVHPAMLEEAIGKNPFVESVDLFVDGDDRIQIHIAQRLPVIRIINNQRVSYYLDDHGKRMPCSSKFTARVPVVTGFIFTNAVRRTAEDSLIERKLFELADFIRKDSFLAALTDQIVVNQKQEFEIIPMVGNHTILIGDADQLHEKFNKLKLFYKEGLKYDGWAQYSVINLKYANEVYCTKK